MNDSIDVVEKQLAAFNARDADAFSACYSDDIVVAVFGGKEMISGIADFRAHTESTFQSSPNLHCDVPVRFSVGENVIQHELLTGVNTPGQPSEQDFAVVYQFKDGKINRLSYILG